MNYTEQEIQQALEQLNIHPLEGMINSAEVARVLSYRAEREHHTRHQYTPADVRRKVDSKTLLIARRVNDRLNLFKTEDAFSADLQPQKWRRHDEFSGVSENSSN